MLTGGGLNQCFQSIGDPWMAGLVFDEAGANIGLSGVLGGVILDGDRADASPATVVIDVNHGIAGDRLLVGRRI
ncbi:hypothetical protein BV898_00015 [Hypsibius exemplaris]|uniref:Uncharacterized protein n=1 Tax=Hypsibius exemplaris TaxID=2072580 RepID=A0A1W0XEG8_HYPEX|nr:hypothetical protein BV898_00015 [Hypsibius exemplaris]